MRNLLIAVLLIAMIIVLPGPVVAGIGTPDGPNVYANVGVLIIFDTDIPEDPVGANVSTFCSGVLISDTHFLTAAHCVDWISLVQNPYVGVSFSNVSAPIIGCTIPAIDWDMQPNYPAGIWVSPGQSPGAGSGLQDDLGVITLAWSAGVSPASLPAEGYLDLLTAKGGLAGHPIVNVGYGVVPTVTGPPGYAPPDGIRRVSTSRFLGLTQNYLLQRENTKAGDQGTSYQGDSGSPKFLPDDPNTILSITSWGSMGGRGFGASVRTDTPEALSFIQSVINP